MNLPALPPIIEQNKAAAAGVGAVAVVGFALYQRRKSGGAATGPDAGAALSAGSQTAAASGGAAYDSTASDIYGAIQPQLEAIGQQLTQLQNPKTIPAPSTPTVKVDPQPKTPTPPVKPAPKPPAPKPVAKPPVPHTTIPKPAPKPVAKPVPKPTPKVAPKTTTYKVKPGDSLSKIAARYPSKSITWKTIYSANKSTIGSNPNLIKPGQTLVIR